jgi:hypothetical protein
MVHSDQPSGHGELVSHTLQGTLPGSSLYVPSGQTVHALHLSTPSALSVSPKLVSEHHECEMTVLHVI